LEGEGTKQKEIASAAHKSSTVLSSPPVLTVVACFKAGLNSFAKQTLMVRGWGLQVLFVSPPSRELILPSTRPPIRNFIKKVTVTAPVLTVTDLHSTQAERTATVTLQHSEHSVLHYTVLCRVHLTDRCFLFAYAVGTPCFFIACNFERHCTLILLLVHKTVEKMRVL